MKRASVNFLKSWLLAQDRKPLIIRGARQVGKTWLVRHFAKISNKQLIELNFEREPSYESLFESNDPVKTLENIAAILGEHINPEQSILFLDEIQACPALLAKLRWFAEDMPQLPVITAGSLLDFVLADHAFSMPVGRVSYMHLEPLSFEEFLLANNKKTLFDYLLNYEIKSQIPVAIHKQLSLLFNEYLIVGGLPAVVSSWVSQRQLNKVAQLQNDLLTTYRDDFAKYRGKIALERFNEVLQSIPQMLGQKFVYSKVNKTVQSSTIKQVLDLIEKARICSSVKSTAANGVPLGAEVRERYFKQIFLDVGLSSSALGLNLAQLNSVNDLTMVNSGSIAEQVVGQLLKTLPEPYIEPSLYYWQREQTSSNAEIDYVIQHQGEVVPIEVKAGSTGSMKSLHVFMGLKNIKRAIRINSNTPGQMHVALKNNMGHAVNYDLISIPFYLVGQINRLL